MKLNGMHRLDVLKLWSFVTRIFNVFSVNDFLASPSFRVKNRHFAKEGLVRTPNEAMLEPTHNDYFSIVERSYKCEISWSEDVRRNLNAFPFISTVGY